MAGVGFNIQHDGNHGAYSRHGGVNKAAALSLNLLGGDAYFWHFKHNIAHHTYPNVTGSDDDIRLGPLARLSPHQPALLVPPLPAPLRLGALRAAGDQLAALGRLPVDDQAGRRRHAVSRARADGTWSASASGKASFLTLAFVDPAAASHRVRRRRSASTS